MATKNQYGFMVQVSPRTMLILRKKQRERQRSGLKASFKTILHEIITAAK